MNGCKNFFRMTLPGLVIAVAIWSAQVADAYVEIPYSLGRLLQESTHVVTMRVEKVDKEKNLIIYRKVQDVKNTHPVELIRHNIGRAGFHPREWQTIMDWAEVGKMAVFMHNGGASETYIDGYWYQAYPNGEWWGMSHAEPFLLRSYAGKPDKLAPIITNLMAGQEVIVPCMVDGDKMALQLRTARMQRMKASLKIQDYNPQRDFQGWGGNEDFRRLAGMPGFSHFSDVTRVAPGAGGIAVTDVDKDGKPDFCLFGESKTVLLTNDGKSLNESSLAGAGGSRAADWADYNGDGLPDLLLATATGPRLLTNTGKGFKDDTAALPSEPYYNATAAAWIDQDGDAKPDILLGNGLLGMRLYRNAPPPPEVANRPPLLGKWQFIGPFDNVGNRGFDAVYPPEQKIDLKAEYAGKNGVKCVWKEGAFTDGKVNSLAIFPDNNDVVAYVYRELNFPSAAELQVSLGSDDSLQVFLNGQRILAENVARAAVPDSHVIRLKLRAGKNDLLLKIGQGTGDFGFYFLAAAPADPVPLAFTDVSNQVGLGPAGISGAVRGDHLAVADVNGDGRADFLYSAGRGVLALNTPAGFVESKGSGIDYAAGGVRPAFGDFDGDKLPDLFVPQNGVCRLFKNAGGGKFADVTAASGALAQGVGQATSVAWADFEKRGRPDLFVGCLRGPNRYFRNLGGGKFQDATAELGLAQRVFNTRGLCAADINGDGTLDLIFNNEGPQSAALLGDVNRLGDRSAAR